MVFWQNLRSKRSFKLALCNKNQKQIVDLAEQNLLKQWRRLYVTHHKKMSRHFPFLNNFSREIVKLITENFLISLPLGYMITEKKGLR
jgi:hypothetical protein